MATDIRVRRADLQSLVGKKAELYLEGRTTSFSVTVERKGDGFVGLDEIGTVHPIFPEDYSVYGRTILFE